MALEEATIRYLESQGKGRLATIGRDGRPQNKPVGYRYNADLGTIDISGFNMDTSAKYKNIVTHPDVSFVVDDAIGEGAENMRMLEIRGEAEQAVADSEPDAPVSHLIRIHPRRLISWNIGDEHPGLYSYDAD
ncbi:MAG: PPOX class F420-dependent oxidoreductase [Acidimicrobiales bacterium]